jgi:hypothetical protein
MQIALQLYGEIGGAIGIHVALNIGVGTVHERLPPAGDCA